MKNTKNQGTWCLASVENTEVKAKIAHVGRGKFRIIEDQSGKHLDGVIDASDVLHCRE